MRLLVATNNEGKVRELVEALRACDIEIVRLRDLGDDAPEAPEETGSTFEENALLKAHYYFERTGIVSVADDSGLEVDALDGRPGVYSARYGTEGATDSDRVALLLDALTGVDCGARAARFVCVLALVGPELQETFEGMCSGRINDRPRGENGFGYDPIFVPDGETRTFAEMDPAEKAPISHRGRAFEAFARYLGGER